MQVYYAQAWPRDLLTRFLEAHKSRCEVILRPRVGAEPIRHLTVGDMSRMVADVQPVDGVHVAFTDHADSPLVLDIDHTPTDPPALWCGCTDGGRRICDSCWITLCGALRSYEFVLRRHFGCSQLLASFSGGRGWHLFVLDPPPQGRGAVYAWLRQTVPNALRHSITALARLCSRDSRRLYTLDAVCASALPRQMLGGDTVCDKVDTIAVLLYRTVMVPFFRDVWMPRVAHTTSERAALVTASTALTGELARGYTAANALIVAAERASRELPPLENRLDAFLAIGALFWALPDDGLRSAVHPIRLWWSPHGRSGNFSLPLPIRRAHDLMPGSQTLSAADAATPGTTAHSWLQISRQEVADLLHRSERCPRAPIWPT